jgi:RimJ/RimL family protein N-acetyltransferase
MPNDLNPPRSGEDFARALAHPPTDGDLRLDPLAEHHRADLKAACALDPAIWPIYSVSWNPDHFDAAFDALRGNPVRIPFAIILGDRLVGMSAYLGLDSARQTVEIGNTYYVPAVRGTGLNGRVKRILLGHAFASGIRRVEFRVDDRNTRSKAAVKKIGGVLEGILRADRITWTGHVRDTALFSILAGEYQA